MRPLYPVFLVALLVPAVACAWHDQAQGSGAEPIEAGTETPEAGVPDVGEPDGTSGDDSIAGADGGSAMGLINAPLGSNYYGSDVGPHHGGAGAGGPWALPLALP